MTTADRYDYLLPSFPSLSPLHSVLQLTENSAQIGNADRAVTIAGGPSLLGFLEALDGRSSTSELRRRFPDDVAILADLVQAGLVLDSRELSGLSFPELATISVLGPAASAAERGRRLREATVLIVGCGPVAAEAAVLLSKAGVADLALSDDNACSTGDAATSTIFASSSVGEARSAVVARAVCETGGRATCVAGANPRDLTTDATLVLIEHRSLEHDVRSTCPALAMRYLVHDTDGLTAVIGPSTPPGGSPCHRCADSRRLSHLASPDAYLAYREYRRVNTGNTPDAVLAAHTAIVGGMLAQEALDVLLNPNPATTDGALVIDLFPLAVTREPLMFVPGCPCCGR